MDTSSTCNTAIAESERFFLSFETKKKKKVFAEILLSLLALFLPILLACLLFSKAGFSLLDHNGNTALMVDAKSQYIAFLVSFRRLILDGGSLLYTEGKCFGGSYMTLYSFYLSSPFNLLLLLIAEEDVPLFFLWSSIVKMGLGSFNFYLFLRFSTHKPKLGYLIFAFAYGLLSYDFLYIFNFMWMDDVALLPLVLLGIEEMRERRHFWLYPLSLGLTILANWYLGALVCIFLIFYLLLNLFLSEKGKRITFLRDAVIYSLLGGMLSALLLFPTLLHMEGTKATFAMGSRRFFSLSTFFNGFLENSYVSLSQIQDNMGYASLFCGVVSYVFFLEFFFNKGYKWEEKVMVGILFLVYMFSILDSILYTLFHGGREPTWFPTRYSFAIDALLLAYGGKCFAKQEKVSPLATLAVVIVPVFVILIALYIPAQYDKKSGAVSYVLSIPSLLIYCSAALVSLLPSYLSRTKFLSTHQKMATFFVGLALTPLSALSVYRGADHILSANKEDGESYSTYLDDISYQEDVDRLLAYDKSDNYRMEITTNRKGSDNHKNNNPLFYSYPGVSHFSSTEVKEVENYLKKLGFYYDYFGESYEAGSTLAINSYLGIKYLMDPKNTEENAKAQFLHNSDSRNPVKELDITPLHDDVHYYELTSSLPLGYVTERQHYSYIGEGEYVKDEEGNNTEDIHYYNFFEYQNNLYKNLTSAIVDGEGKSKDIFVPLTSFGSIYLSKGILMTHLKEGGYFLEMAPANSAITFYYEVPKEEVGGNLYFAEGNVNDNYTISADNTYLYNYYYYRRGILGLKDTKSHTHSVTYRFTKETSGIKINPSFYVEDLSVLDEYLSSLRKESALNLKKIEGRFTFGYEGNFELSEDGDTKDFLFTFPYEKQFKVYIDNKEAVTKKSFNVFLSVPLNGYSKGVHSIKLVYQDTPFYLGALVSLLSLLSVIVLAVLEPLHYRKKEEKEKRRMYTLLTDGLAFEKEDRTE